MKEFLSKNKKLKLFVPSKLAGCIDSLKIEICCNIL